MIYEAAVLLSMMADLPSLQFCYSWYIGFMEKSFIYIIL